ncbi:DUF6122 family protein [Desulfonema magnum]|uniref:DUF6122 family protein n=1 Tax=Desulfonema magnum TaxID=45655 RepID=UPI001A9BA276|nr:DUF6122 family protein [Desulfonema magnum]
MIRSVIHLSLHFIIPGIVARSAFAERWKNAWFVMVLTMAVDFDHFLADPVYNPGRCSIGFHPLHSYLAIFVYMILTVTPKTRLVGLGLLIHMALDGIDCIWMAWET